MIVKYINAVQYTDYFPSNKKLFKRYVLFCALYPILQ